MRQLLLILFTLATVQPAKAQMLLGIGGQADFPFMFNDYIGGYHHHQGNPGFRVVGTYLSPNSTFSPGLTLSVSPAALPVQWVQNEFALSMHFIHTHAMLFGRLQKKLRNGQYFLYGLGIGVSHFSGDGVSSGGGVDVELRYTLSDSSKFINTFAPTVAFNLEYIRPIKEGTPFYWSIGGKLQYLYFFDKKTTYRIDIIDNKGRYFKAEPRLFGHTVNPMLFINIYYQLSGRRGY